MKNNISEIAKLAGVSTATVSRALNNKGPIREDTRRKILKIAREVNYRPSVVAQSLAGKKTQTIGLILPEIEGAFYTSMINAIDRELKKFNYYLLVSSSHSQFDITEDIINLMSSGRIDGVMLMAPLIYRELPAILPKINLPIVTINTGKALASVSVFNVDNYQGAYAMTEHFIEQGLKRIATIKGPEGNFDSAERFRGYLDALKDNGIKFQKQYAVTGDFTNKGGYYGFSRLICLRERPQAIFAANDMTALGVYEAARNMKIRIPEDIVVGGFDDIYLGRMVSPQLSTVHVPAAELGIKALQHLLKIIRGEVKNGGYEETLSTGLIIRESSRCSQKEEN
jgi:LacI family transcriptional regulator